MKEAEPAKTHRKQRGQTSSPMQRRQATHSIGTAKSTAPLIALRLSDFEIIAHSAEISDLLGCKTQILLGLNFMETLEHIAQEILALPVQSHITYDLLDFAPSLDGVKYDAVTHVHQGIRIIEFLPTLNTSRNVMIRKQRRSNNACLKILQEPEFGRALQIAAETTREITGYARIKIHSLHPEWTKGVVAESCDGTILSNLGHNGIQPDPLHQLLSAIEGNRSALAADPNENTLFTLPLGEKLDLSFSVGNSISEMYAICLHKMGIKAALSYSLRNRGKLWGTITAHNTTPGPLPFQDWCLLQEIASALVARHDQETHINAAMETNRLRDVEKEFATALKVHDTPEDTLRKMTPVLQKYMRADGFALLYRGKLFLSGSTPPQSFLPSLIDWVGTQGQSPKPFQTTQLYNFFPAAEAHIETACGVTLWATPGQSMSRFIWFRGPDPIDVERHPLSDIHSASWQLLPDSRAQDDLANFLQSMVSQVTIAEENKALRQFSEMASHDLKAPLRGIILALDIMQEEGFDQKHVKEMHAIAATSARRLTNLTTSLLDLADVGREKFEFTPVALRSVFESAQEMLHLQFAEAGASLTYDALPSVPGNELLLHRLALNLLDNAVKFRRPDKPLDINISAIRECDQFVEIAVTDTGIGIAPEYAARVFEPLQRLHSQDEIDGSGLGLAICEKIMALHQGHLSLDIGYEDGARFILRLDKTLKINRPCQRQQSEKVHIKQ